MMNSNRTPGHLEAAASALGEATASRHDHTTEGMHVMSELKDAAIFALGAWALHSVGTGQWVLWVGGALAASALARGVVEQRRRVV